jgi:hypothetical protein
MGEYVVFLQIKTSLFTLLLAWYCRRTSIARLSLALGFFYKRDLLCPREEEGSIEK